MLIDGQPYQAARIYSLYSKKSHQETKTTDAKPNHIGLFRPLTSPNYACSMYIILDILLNAKFKFLAMIHFTELNTILLLHRCNPPILFSWRRCHYC